MNALKLYEVANEVEALLNQVDEDGCYPDDLASKLDQFKDKGVSVLGYMLNVKATVEAKDAAIKRMKASRDADQRRIDFIEEYLKSNMSRCGITEISCPEFTAKLYPNRDESVEIEDLGKIPCQYVEEKITYQADKKAIKEAIKRGEDIEGAKIVSKHRLTIK